MKENKNWKKQIALFLISQNLSMFGSSVVGFSIVWYITVTTESGFWITLSTLATLIPQVLVSLWAGVFADRYNKKTIIMLADGFTALATLLAFVAFHYGFANLSFLIFIACLRSVGGGFQAPAVNALYPEIVPRSICSGSTVSTRWRIMCCCCFLRQPAALFWVCLGCSGLF